MYSVISCGLISDTVAPMMNKLIFERAPKLSIGALSRQSPLRLMDALMSNWPQQLLVIVRAILAAAIRVENQPPGRTPGGSPRNSACITRFFVIRSLIA